MPREYVHVGQESCSTCLDLLNPHQGELAAARHSHWTLRSVTTALNDLSRGASYASVGTELRHRGKAVREHIITAHSPGLALTGQSLTTKSQSRVARHGRTSWHLAADLVEQYGPPLFAHVMDQVHQREADLRAANDDLLSGDPAAVLSSPITYVLDELPIYINRRIGKGRGRSLPAWSLLIVVELRWHQPKDPFSLPDRQAVLRLARAYPLGNEDAWRLVLRELGVRPDFVVADSSSAILNAVATEWSGAVGIIPSFFHIQRNIRAALLNVPQATTKLVGRTVLIDPLRKHLETLTRDEITRLTDSEWAMWWDDLFDLLHQVNAPIAGFVEQRRAYETRVAAALGLLRSHPHLPASNAAVEAQLRMAMDPFLESRKALYRNLARTNFLFDLAVCRAQGLFVKPDDVGALIRSGNSAAGGWAPRARIIGDAQPGRRGPPGTKRPLPYSSLLNPLLVRRLLTKRIKDEP